MNQQRYSNISSLSWKQVKDIILAGDLHLLGRSSSQQETYDRFRKQVKEEWETLSDYLFSTKLGYEKTISSSTGKYMAFKPLSSLEKLVLLPNDFPYNFEDGIIHFILWKVGNVITDDEINDIINQEFNSGSRYSDYAVYINPSHLKSIPDIEHAHILFHVKR
jgi:hypothetical protein